ncbi:MAG: ubiquinone biosynthesis protein UbiB [Candidatus Pelagibacter sp.]|nr:ubiquinone biosynthesis protein UbiB [Candidatus Pelagibacter sp.]
MYHLIFVVKIKNIMKVCILGNGLTALTLAKTLVNLKINVEVLYTKENLYFSKTRTVGISKSNINFFNEKIISINSLLWKLKKIEIFSDNLFQEKLINFEKNNEEIFSIIQNHKLYKTLKNDLSKNKFYNSKLFNKKNLFFINNYNLIINCDPLNIITKKYFSKKIIKKYNSRAYTTIINHDKITNNIALQIFTKEGPLAFLPISNNKTSIVFSIQNSEDQQKINIEKLIKDKNFRYKIRNINKLQSFDLQSLSLRSYYHKNILAFGDLLHKVHPLVGQGFNMTIRDIKIFTSIIKNRMDLGLPLDNSINIEFENNAKYKNLIFSSGIDLIHEFFNFERKIKSKFLSKSVQKINKYPLINKVFKTIADRGIFF